MSKAVIQVENLSKKYLIGNIKRPYRTFRETLMNFTLSPFYKFGKLLKGERSGASELTEELWALKDICFDIKEGETVGIVGNNGAGKSTLLKILSRITRPTTGKATLQGRLGSLLEVGTGFHPELTGRENILLNGSILGMRRSDILKKFDEIVEFAGIERFLDTPVKHYSSGMYIRLAFSVAAHLEPEILIVDEVLAVGDIRFQKKCLGKMEQVGKSGRTVLFVSHNMSAIQSLCERGILLSEGKIKEDGPIRDVVQTYIHSFQLSGSKIAWSEGKEPGNASLRILSMQIKNSDGKNVDHLYLSEEVTIEFHFLAKRKSQAIFSLTLITQDGNCAFSTKSNRAANFHGKLLSEGIYVAQCQIYPNLLNSGRYYISLTGFSGQWSDSFSIERVITFEAVDDGILRGDYSGPCGGPVRPDLKWEVSATL